MKSWMIRFLALCGLALLLTAKSNKCKAARTACFAVQGNMEINRPSKVFKQGADFVFSCGEGQIAHVEFHRCYSVDRILLVDGYTS